MFVVGRQGRFSAQTGASEGVLHWKQAGALPSVAIGCTWVKTAVFIHWFVGYFQDVALVASGLATPNPLPTPFVSNHSSSGSP